MLETIFTSYKNTRTYDLNFGENYFIKKIYFKIDINTYHDWINNPKFFIFII